MSHHCDPNEVALKSFFLGPQAENGQWVQTEVFLALNSWFEWRRQQFPEDGQAISFADQTTPEFIQAQKKFADLFHALIERYKGEMPKYSPRYIGHMFSEVSLPALLGHLITLMHNPNNISGESSLVGVEIENEAIAELNKMFGFPIEATGHFTSGGTVANFEAMLRAKQLSASRLAKNLKQQSGLNKIFYASHRIEQSKTPEETKLNWSMQNPLIYLKEIEQISGEVFFGPVLLIPENKHYSWKKAAHLLGLSDDAFWPIQLDENGKLDTMDLKIKIEKAKNENRPILMVVSVAGTTEMASIDPIHQVQAIIDDYASQGIHIWHHIDAAYGGFFCTLEKTATAILSDEDAKALSAFSKVNSITIDPHKLGYVPYACGAFLIRQPKEYYVRTYDSPYIEYTPNQDKGIFTLEGSRSAAGATATWLTAKSIGLNSNGYGRIIARTIRIRDEFAKILKEKIPNAFIIESANTNILCFCLAKNGENIQLTNERNKKIYQRFSPQAHADYYISKTVLQKPAYTKLIDHFSKNWTAQGELKEIVMLRLCLMNPFINSHEMKTQFMEDFINQLKNFVEQIEL